jgi:outer membrane protein assembly factor BamA
VSVYNLGITNQKDLKATNLSLQRSNSFNNLVAEPVLQSVSSQKTAWYVHVVNVRENRTGNQELGYPEKLAKLSTQDAR